jgi:hypothetical protein
MTEQNVNVHLHKFLGKACFALVACLSIFLSACMPTRDENVNTELFKDKDDLKQRAAQLRPGLQKKRAFEMLGVSDQRFQRMNVAEIQANIYGNSQVQGTPEQLEGFRKRLMSYEGYALPYKVIKSDSSLGFGKMKMNKTGQDLRLVLIFEGDRLMRCNVEGTEDVRLQQDEYLWSTLIQKGIGMAF